MKVGIYRYTLDIDTADGTPTGSICIGEWNPSLPKYANKSPQLSGIMRVEEELNANKKGAGRIDVSHINSFKAIIRDFPNPNNKQDHFDSDIHQQLRKYQLHGEWFDAKLTNEKADQAIEATAKSEKWIDTDKLNFGLNSLQKPRYHDTLTFLNSKETSMLLDMPTGSGKTFTSMMAFADSNCQTAIIYTWMPNVLVEWFNEISEHEYLSSKIIVCCSDKNYTTYKKMKNLNTNNLIPISNLNDWNALSTNLKKVFIVSAYMLMEHADYNYFKWIEQVPFDAAFNDETHRCGYRLQQPKIAVDVVYEKLVQISATTFKNRSTHIGDHKFDKISTLTLQEIYDKKDEVVAKYNAGEALSNEDEYFLEVPKLSFHIRMPSEETRKEAESAGLNQWDVHSFLSHGYKHKTVTNNDGTKEKDASYWKAWDKLDTRLDSARAEYVSQFFEPTRTMGKLKPLSEISGVFPLSREKDLHTILVTKTGAACRSLEEGLRSQKFDKEIIQLHSWQEDLPRVKKAIIKHDYTFTISCGAGLTGTNIPGWSRILFEYDPKSLIETFQYCGRILRRNGPEKAAKGVQAWFSSVDAVFNIIYQEAESKCNKNQKEMTEYIRNFLNLIPISIYDDKGITRSVDPNEILKKGRDILTKKLEQAKETDKLVSVNDAVRKYITENRLFQAEIKSAPKSNLKEETTVILNKDEQYKKAKQAKKEKTKLVKLAQKSGKPELVALAQAELAKTNDEIKAREEVAALTAQIETLKKEENQVPVSLGVWGDKIIGFIQLSKSNPAYHDSMNFEDLIKMNSELFVNYVGFHTLDDYYNLRDLGFFNEDLIERTIIVSDNLPVLYSNSYQTVPVELVPFFNLHIVNLKKDSVLIVGGGQFLAKLARELNFKHITYVAFSKEESTVISYMFPKIEITSLEKIGEKKMTFDAIIGNPPYNDPELGKESGKLYDKIWEICKTLSKNIVFLCPRAFIKYQDFTNAEFIGKFPGVGQEVGIFCNTGSVIKQDITKWGFQTHAQIKEKYEKNGMYAWQKENEVSPSLANIISKSCLINDKIPNDHLGVNDRSGEFNCFLPGEIPCRKNGKLYKTICLLETKNPQKLKEYLITKNSDYKQFNKKFGKNHIFQGFHKTIYWNEDDLK
jgi:hypothetical protein